MKCKHREVQLQHKVIILEDREGEARLDIRVKCLECHTFFTFKGNYGYHPNHPTVSVDRYELRAPLTIKSAEINN